MRTSTVAESLGRSVRLLIRGARHPQLGCTCTMLSGAPPRFTTSNCCDTTGPPRAAPRSTTGFRHTSGGFWPAKYARARKRMVFMAAAFTVGQRSEQVQMGLSRLPATFEGYLGHRILIGGAF